MPTHAQLNDHILYLQREFQQGGDGAKERVSDVLLLSSSALSRACGMALLKQARWTVREASRLVILSDMIYGDVRQVIKRQHQERMPSGFTTGTSGLAGAALDVSTDATIAAAAASRNCHKGGERPPVGSDNHGGDAAYPTLPSGMQMSKLVIVDAILHETPNAVASTLRTLERQTGVRLVLCCITDERPTAGVGYRLHPSCTLSEDALYEEGYDLVIQQCLDHSTVRMITSIFIPQSQLFERGVASGARTVTGNYAKIRHILGEVTDRSGVVAAGAHTSSNDSAAAVDQLLAQHNAVASSSLGYSFTTRGKKVALMSAQTVGPSTSDCIDTHPDYLKILARYEYSLKVIERLQSAVQSSKVVDSDKGAELEQARLELDEANVRVDALTAEVDDLRKSELLVDQVIHTNNRVRDAHQRTTLSHTLAIYKEKYAVVREESDGQALEILRLQAEVEALKAQLSSAQQVANFPLPSSRRVSGSLFSRPHPVITPLLAKSLDKHAIGDYAAVFENASLAAHDYDSGYGIPLPRPSLTFAAERCSNVVSQRSQPPSQPQRSSSSLALPMSVRSIATQTAPISWAGALPLEEIEEYLQVSPGSLGKSATASDTLDAITQHIVAHLTTTLSSSVCGKGGYEDDITQAAPPTLGSRGNPKRQMSPEVHDGPGAVFNQGDGTLKSTTSQHDTCITDKPLSPTASIVHNGGAQVDRRSYSLFDGVQPRTPGGGFPLRGSSSPRSTPSVVLSSSNDPSLNPPPPLPSANASRYVIRQSLR